MFVYGKHIEEFRIDKRELGGNLVSESFVRWRARVWSVGFCGNYTLPSVIGVGFNVCYAIGTLLQVYPKWLFRVTTFLYASLSHLFREKESQVHRTGRLLLKIGTWNTYCWTAIVLSPVVVTLIGSIKRSQCSSLAIYLCFDPYTKPFRCPTDWPTGQTVDFLVQLANGKIWRTVRNTYMLLNTPSPFWYNAV